MPKFVLWLLLVLGSLSGCGSAARAGCDYTQCQQSQSQSTICQWELPRTCRTPHCTMRRYSRRPVPRTYVVYRRCGCVVYRCQYSR